MFFSNAHGILTKVYHILGHKIHFNKFKVTEIIQVTFSDDNGIKTKFNKNTRENLQTCGQ